MARDYSKGIAAAMEEFLKSEEWTYRFDDEEGVFTFGLTLRCQLQRIRYFISIATDEYTVYGISPVGARPDDPELMKRACEFITRANYNLRNGNFEIDCEDGEVRYKSYVNCDGIVLSQEIVRDSVWAVAAMFTKYGEGLLKIFFTDAEPEQIIDACESDC